MIKNNIRLTIEKVKANSKEEVKVARLEIMDGTEWRELFIHDVDVVKHMEDLLYGWKHKGNKGFLKKLK